MSNLILPGHPLFNLTLGMSLPANLHQIQAQTNGEMALIVRPGSLLLEAIPMHEAEEYVFGGEYDERLEEIGEDNE